MVSSQTTETLELELTNLLNTMLQLKYIPNYRNSYEKEVPTAKLYLSVVDMHVEIYSTQHTFCIHFAYFAPTQLSTYNYPVFINFIL